VVSGHRDVFQTLLDAGLAARDPSRAPLALSVGYVALRQPAALLDAVEARGDLEQVADLLQEAFDMLAEDFDEEQWYVEMRRTYWAVGTADARKHAAQVLMERLEF
jgi:hypothetical protein